MREEDCLPTMKSRPSPPSSGLASKRAKLLRPTLQQFADDDDDSVEEEQGPAAGASGSAAEALRLKEEGQQHAERSEWVQALAAWDRALALVPHPTGAQRHTAAELMELRAQVLIELGKEFDAIKAATQAVGLAPEMVEAHMTLARAQVNFGEPRLAVKALQRVLQLQPGHAEAKAELSTVQMLSLQQERAGAGRRAHVIKEEEQEDGAAPGPGQGTGRTGHGEDDAGT